MLHLANVTSPELTTNPETIMNPKLPKTAIVVLIIALLGSAWLSIHVARKRRAETLHAQTSGVRAGFNKFLSQVSWMRLIQFRGSMQSVTKENAPALSKKYNQLTDLDPLFADAYEEGALDIANMAPEESLRLLDKAMAEKRITSWKIPFIAGMIAKRQLNDNDRALRYLEQAAKRPEHPAYVVRSMMYSKAEAVGKDPMDVLNLWVDYLGPTVTDGRFQKGMIGPGIWTQDPEVDHQFALKNIARVASEIVDKARKDLPTETDSDRKKALQDRVAQTERLVGLAYGKTHLCLHCFRPYAAGERFCSYDGTPVAVYGVCPKDGVTIVHGAYCHVCGAKVN